MRIIFRASIVVNGKRIYARDYGKKAFRIDLDKCSKKNKAD